jgi:hypothetical protein
MSEYITSILSHIMSAVKGLFVETAQSDAARQTLREFFLSFYGTGLGGCMTLQGVSGSGKTTLLKNFLTNDIPRLANTKESRALYVELPSKCSPKSVAQAILQALGDPAWFKGSGSDLKYRIGKLIHKKGYCLLALDECQHLIEARSEKVLYDVADWLKSSINLWSIPVILSGLPKLQAIIEANDQLDNRTFRSAMLGPIDWSISDQRRDYRLILKRIDESLPFAQRAHLEDPTVAKSIHSIADGLLGKTAKLIILAATIANRAGHQTITTESLGKAFDELRREQDESKANPFLDATSKAQPAGEKPTASERPLQPSEALHRALSTKSDE